MNTDTACVVCRRFFPTVKLMRTHFNTMHNKKKHACAECPKIFSTNHLLARHERAAHPPIKNQVGRECGPRVVMEYKCQHCDLVFNKCTKMKMHQMKEHKQIYADASKIQREMRRANRKQCKATYGCDLCDLMFCRKYEVYEHIERVHQVESCGVYVEQMLAFHKYCITYVSDLTEESVLSVPEFFQRDTNQLIRILKYESAMKRVFKYALILKCTMERPNPLTDLPQEIEFMCRTRQVLGGQNLSQSEHLMEVVDHFQRECIDRIENFTEAQGSGWRLICITHAHLEIAKCRPLAGGNQPISRLPKDFSGRKYLSPYKNEPLDGKCFYRACAKIFTPKSTTFAAMLFCEKNMKTDFGTPFEIRNLDAFEKGNKEKLNISVNIVLAEGKNLYPVRVGKSSLEENCKVVNLLMYRNRRAETETEAEEEEEEEEEGETGQLVTPYHFVYITDLSRFVNAFENGLREETRQNRLHPKHVCINCMNFWSSRSALTSHQFHCFTHDAQKITMPCEEDRMKFRRFDTKVKQDVYGAFDFESKMVPTNVKRGSKTTIIHEQKVVSFSLVIVDSNDNILFRKTKASEEDALSLFYEALEEAEDWLSPRLAENVPMIMTLADEARYAAATHCYLCTKKFSQNNDPTSEMMKVRDHSHFDGCFINACHMRCNRDRRRQTKIPLYCHNFSG